MPASKQLKPNLHMIRTQHVQSIVADETGLPHVLRVGDRWTVIIGVEGIAKNLGLFSSKLDAMLALDNALTPDTERFNRVAQRLRSLHPNSIAS